MTSIGVSTLAQSFALRRHNEALKSELQIASSEMVTGQKSDPARFLNGEFGPLASIDRALMRFKSFHTVQQDMKTQLTAVQSTLEFLDSLATNLASSVHSTTLSASDAQVAALASVAHQNLKSALFSLNTKAADRAVFAGSVPDQVPVPDAEVILTALKNELAGVATPEEARGRIADWFSDADGFARLYRGGTAQEPILVSDTDSLRVSVTALDPAVTQTLAGFAMGALVDAGLFSGQPDNRSAMINFAAQSLTEATDTRIILAANIGRVEERLQSISTRMSAEASALQTARSDLIGVDPYEAASRLKAAETQLQSLYTVTARMTRLTLADYI